MCGMTLAMRLAQGGQKVTLYEAADHLGGLADAWSLEGMQWDRHYHVTLLSDSCTRNVLADIGLEQELRWHNTRTGYFDGDRLVSMSNSWEYLKLPGLSPLGKLRLAWTIIHASRLKDWHRLEGIPVEEWLTRLSGKAVFERLWKPLLLAKLGERYRDCSAAFLWATIKRLYAARDSGLKRERFGYVRGGYGAVTAAFESRLKRLGVDLRLGCPVTSVEAKGEGWQVEVADAEPQQYERVVATVTPRRIAKLCPGLNPEERSRLEGVAYQGLLCASLVLDRPLAEYYLTYLTGRSFPFTAVIEMSTLVDPAELGGRHLVYLPLYLSSDDPRFRAPEEEIRQSFLAGLASLYPHFSNEQVLAFRLSRVAEVFPLPVLDYSRQMPPMSSSCPGLHFVNAAQIVNGTLNVNETIGLAERAAVALLASDGRSTRMTEVVNGIVSGEEAAA